MGRLRFTTAGESHGPAVLAVVEGVPAGLDLLAAHIDADLARRQGGYGRGRRMAIERDRVEFLSGVRAGETLGSPLTLLVRNRDWANWEAIMDPAPRPEDDAPEGRRRQLTRVRPGHADLTGLLKYDRADARDILERASARETTARVAAGAVARRLLESIGVSVGSHVVQLGGVTAPPPPALPDDLNAVADASDVRCLDAEAAVAMRVAIDAAREEGDTVGGVAEVVVRGLPVGLGSHVSWDRKLDGRLAQALCSIPAVKGVEMGIGFGAARRPGSAVHDPIVPDPGASRRGHVRRETNHAGGLEGGMTTGAPLVLRVAMKPIATLMRPLATIDTATGAPAEASVERSDVTAVPAMGVIAEAMTALVVADALLEKFGGDSLGELQRNLATYLAHLDARLDAAGDADGDARRG